MVPCLFQILPHPHLPLICMILSLLPFPDQTLRRTDFTSTPIIQTVVASILLPPLDPTALFTVPTSAITLLPLRLAHQADAEAVLVTLTTKIQPWASLLTPPLKTLPTPAKKPPADRESKLSNVDETNYATVTPSSRMSCPSQTRRAAKFRSWSEPPTISFCLKRRIRS